MDHRCGPLKRLGEGDKNRSAVVAVTSDVSSNSSGFLIPKQNIDTIKYFNNIMISLAFHFYAGSSSLFAQQENNKETDKALVLYRSLENELNNAKSIDNFNDIFTTVQSVNADRFMKLIENSDYNCRVDRGYVYKNYPRPSGSMITLCNADYILWFVFDDATSIFVKSLSGSRTKKTVNDYALKPRGEIK